MNRDRPIRRAAYVVESFGVSAPGLDYYAATWARSEEDDDE